MDTDAEEGVRPGLNGSTPPNMDGRVAETPGMYPNGSVFVGERLFSPLSLSPGVPKGEVLAVPELRTADDPEVESPDPEPVVEPPLEDVADSDETCLDSRTGISAS